MLWGGNLAEFGSPERKQAELPRLERENGTNLRLLREVHRSLGGIRTENQMREGGRNALEDGVLHPFSPPSRVLGPIISM